MKGLALSGGGSRGSFQVGALEYLYKRLNYRPDLIASTSVGSINALALAQAGTPAEHVAQIDVLLGIWRGLTGPHEFYLVQPWFQRVTGSSSLNLGGFPSARIENVLAELVFNDLIGSAGRSTSLAVLDPLELKMRDPALFNAERLAAGVPLCMVCVSLETGRVRYATGDGRFVESDNSTPVASALASTPDISSAHSAFATAVSRVRTLMGQIQAESQGFPHRPDWRKVARLKLELERALWRAEAAHDQLAARNRSLGFPVQARVDPIRGALASSALPGIFGPYQIGEEHYVDGGIRENVPVRPVIQMGATEVIAIACSSQHMPKAGYAGGQDFLTNLVGSLTGIALKELIDDDLAEGEASGVPVTVIIPSFDCHDGAVVEMGLIHIAMAYGYMRAADVMTPMSEPERRAAELLSDAITRVRTETHLLAGLWTRPSEPDAHAVLEQLRLRKWIIRKLVETRIASGIGIPQFASLWFQTWEQGGSGIPNIPNPWQYFTTLSQTTPAVNPYSYVPDAWVYEEEGDLTGLYLVRAGACFRGTAADVGAATGGTAPPALTVPAGTTANLPAVPVAGTVLAEAAPPGRSVQTGGAWITDGTRRYLLNTAAAAAAGAPTPVLVPSGGLAQIPAGGDPYWLGGLVIAAAGPALIHQWEPTFRIEGSRGPTSIMLWNRSSRTVNVTAAQVTTPKDTASRRVFTVKTPVPLAVAAGQLATLEVDFDAFAPGAILGVVAVDCDDPIAPQLRLPVVTSVSPLGAHAELQLSPGQLDFGAAIAGTTVSQELTIHNSGSRPAGLSAKVDAADPAGQFSVNTVFMVNPLPDGESTKVMVSYAPTTRGGARATLAVEMASDTDIPTEKFRHRYEVPVRGIATAPVLMLAGAPRRPWPSPRPLPGPRPPGPGLPELEIPRPPRPVPRQEAELTTLDYGTATAGTSVARSFWIRNVGDAPLTVTGVDYALGLPFSINLSAFPRTLQADEEVEVPSTFINKSLPGGTVLGRFDVRSNDPQRPIAVLNLTGRAAGPHLTPPFPPELLDFGVVVTPATATMTYASDGSDPVSVRALKLYSGAEFSVESVPPVPASIAPGDTITLTVTFDPATPGDYQGNLELTHDGQPGGKSTAFLRGTAV